MIRNVDLNEISDGKLYESNDMAKVDCHECIGCSDCCHNMGNTVVLDPYDVYRLTKGLETDFQSLLTDKISLSVIDGLILPHLNMTGENGACGFLDENGRCSIHLVRPGICRLFPLGRLYTEDGFKYINQINECPYSSKTKVKIKKWIDTPEISRYEKYIADWHFMIKKIGEFVAGLEEDKKRNVCLKILNVFYIMPYDTTADFYDQLEERRKMINM